MSQTVDLGYVVGPTGPKGSDATLPETEKIHFYVACHPFDDTDKFYVKYLSNHQVVTDEVPILDQDNFRVTPEQFMAIECDFGSVVYFTNHNDTLSSMVSCFQLVYYEYEQTWALTDTSYYTLTSATMRSSVAALVPADNLYVWLENRAM